MATKAEGIEPWNFSWVIEGALCACSWPSSGSEITWLKRQGVKTIISLSVERVPPPSAHPDIDCHVIDVEEFEPPSLGQMREFMDICDKSISENKPVCVHCRMGLGRTGVMLACYLVKHFEQTAVQAIHNIRLMRPWSVETRSQEKAVKNFEKYISDSTEDEK